MALGSLVVNLGLDAAQFTSGLSRAEYEARKFGQTIGDGIGAAAKLAASSLVAIGASATGALAGFNALLDGASQFADLADKTGASAEALASFAVAAGTSGTSMDAIAGAANKLTQNLVGVDDQSKAAGAALAAMGIPLKDFKALKPDEQLEKVSKTLAGFEDGAGKSAVAMALFGKSGAELLAFLKTLEEQGGRQKILTQEQIDLGDAYLDQQAKMQTELKLYAQALATQAVPSLTAFTGALTDTTKEILGVVTGSKDLKNTQAIQEFADLHSCLNSTVLTRRSVNRRM
ncbi:MAG: hypothetical protein EOP13_06360 [Pseudomonas sp.]|uniref:hypothetical protein n=1 Tax=Pseudomonas sp. TaxID=306 RepID=UPI001229525A|nr:hypothetical protein [Pseudomonas sp.]RZI75192.1 MAG: hypothetical protein EOP13_06360 [Pseudomonas sp.]